VLLVLNEPELTIAQVSENVGEYFGRSVDSVLGLPVPAGAPE
jgi:light-regulated signal transduction histidine kinase (bacteriophytochrome)